MVDQGGVIQVPEAVYVISEEFALPWVLNDRLYHPLVAQGEGVGSEKGTSNLGLGGGLPDRPCCGRNIVTSVPFHAQLRHV